jgi:hypothetical protein
VNFSKTRIGADGARSACASPKFCPALKSTACTFSSARCSSIPLRTLISIPVITENSVHARPAFWVCCAFPVGDSSATVALASYLDSKEWVFVAREEVDANSGTFAFSPNQNVGCKTRFLRSV